MFNKDKSGKSIILLVIVICVMIFTLIFVSRFFDNKGNEEEAFKLNVYEYYLEIEDYKSKNLEQNINVCGVLKSVIPDIIETDMSKFKIEQGQLVYIGNDEKERQWTNEVKI